MNTLQIHDTFQPYYAGRDEPRVVDDPAKPAKPKDTGPNGGKRAAQQVRDNIQASRQKRLSAGRN